MIKNCVRIDTIISHKIAHRDKNNRKVTLKILKFVPFVANLVQLEANYDIPGNNGHNNSLFRLHTAFRRQTKLSLQR